MVEDNHKSMYMHKIANFHMFVIGTWYQQDLAEKKAPKRIGANFLLSKLDLKMDKLK